jgi:hypothetical protein
MEPAYAALVRCAEIAGEDGEAIESARRGSMISPTIEEFAIRAVQQLRDDYDEAVNEIAELESCGPSDES